MQSIFHRQEETFFAIYVEKKVSILFPVLRGAAEII